MHLETYPLLADGGSAALSDLDDRELPLRCADHVGSPPRLPGPCIAESIAIALDGAVALANPLAPQRTLRQTVCFKQLALSSQESTKEGTDV
jgi:hypothetical protein